MMEIVSNLLTLLFGGGLMGLLQFLIQRHDSRRDRQDEILQKMEDLEEKINSVIDTGDARNARDARLRILHFRDEMLEGRNHTHDSFQQVLADIDEYEQYCHDHPKFKNNQTVATIEHIRRNYAERLEKHDFL